MLKYRRGGSTPASSHSSVTLISSSIASSSVSASPTSSSVGPSFTTRPEFNTNSRLIGRRFDDPTVKEDQELVPYKIVKADNGDAWVQADSDKYSPSQISAMILQKIKTDAEAYLGQPVTQAVIYGWYDNELGSYTNMLGDLTVSITDKMV